MLRQLGQFSLTPALLVGIPLAATVGGMGTINVSPPNLIAAGALGNVGLRIDFLQWMLCGFLLAVFLGAIGYWVLSSLYRPGFLAATNVKGRRCLPF